MSENKITIGFMAELVTPVGNYQTEEWEELQEKLHDKSNLQLNYEGNVVYSSVKNEDAYNFDLHIGEPGSSTDFIMECSKVSLNINASTIKPYFAHWYNGSDSPMSDMTLAKFKE